MTRDAAIALVCAVLGLEALLVPASSLWFVVGSTLVLGAIATHAARGDA